MTASLDVEPSSAPPSSPGEASPEAADLPSGSSIAPSRGDRESFALGEIFAWDGDHLVVTDDAAMKALTRPALSPSTAKAMHGCVARWAAERLISEPPNPFSAAEVGTAGHAVLEDLYGLPAFARTRAAALNILEAHKLRSWPGRDESTVAKRADWHTAVHNAINGLWAIEDPRKVKVAALERGFDADATVCDIPFVGYIDRLDWVLDEDGIWRLKIVDYKGLALDTPIPTPSGWTTMGDLRVGEQVIGSDGRPTTVTVKSRLHNRPCYRLSFSDGSSVVCDNVHLWQVHDLTRGGRAEVLDADGVAERLAELQGKGKAQSLIIPNSSTFEAPAADLPIDPWLLGAWLGDGIAKSGSIVVGADDETDMLALIKGAWHGTISRAVDKRNGTLSFGLNQPEPDACPYGHREFSTTLSTNGARRCLKCGRDYHTGGPVEARTNVPFGTLLHRLGVLNNKHLPVAYLRASAEQRLALLQGLMDMDGSWNPQRQRAVFSTTTLALADGVAELVQSFGLTALRFAKPYKNKKRQDAVSYKVEFTPLGINPFRLPRKAAPVDTFNVRGAQRGHVRATRRYIKSIEPVASVPTQCIQVDAADSLYLAGPAMVPTHNTGKVPKDIGRYGDDHGDQMRLYAEAIRVKSGVMPLTASLYYTQHGKFRDAPLSKSAMSKTLSSFRKAWKDLNEHTERAAYPTEEGPLCGWCPLVNACPVAAQNGRVDRTGLAPTEEFLGIPVRRVLPPKPVEEPRTHSGYGATPMLPPDPNDDFGSAAVASTTADLPPEARPTLPAPPIPVGYDPGADFGSAAETTPGPVAETQENTPPQEAVRVQSDPVAAHDKDREMTADAVILPPTENTEGTPMNATPHLSEDKSWFEESSGVLNANSYSAMAVFGTTSLAYDEINKAGIPLTKETLDAVSKTFLFIVGSVHREFNASPSLMDGLSTRLRGVLRSYIEANPLPWGGDSAAWDAWVAKGVKHTRSMTLAAIRLYAEGPGEQPWAALAVRQAATG